jgi:hypothetical protein
MMPRLVSLFSQVQLDPTIEVGQVLFLSVTADFEERARGGSVACITSRTNSFLRTIPVIFSMTPVDLKPVVKTSWQLFKNLFVANRETAI